MLIMIYVYVMFFRQSLRKSFVKRENFDKEGMFIVLTHHVFFKD